MLGAGIEREDGVVCGMCCSRKPYLLASMCYGWRRIEETTQNVEHNFCSQLHCLTELLQVVCCSESFNAIWVMCAWSHHGAFIRVYIILLYV